MHSRTTIVHTARALISTPVSKPWTRVLRIAWPVLLALLLDNSCCSQLHAASPQDRPARSGTRVPRERAKPARPGARARGASRTRTDSVPQDFKLETVDRNQLTNVLIEPIAVTESPAPKAETSAPDPTFFKFTPPVLNNNGVVAFMATVTGERPYFNAFRRGLFVGTAEDLHSVGWAGCPVAGVPFNGFYDHDRYLHLDGANNLTTGIAFPDGRGTIWQSRDCGSAFGTAASQCRPVNDFAAANGGVFAGLAVHGTDSDTPARSRSPHGLAAWVYKNGRFSFFAQKGETVPNVPEKLTFDRPNPPLLNDKGDVLVSVPLLGPGGLRDESLWVFQNDTMRLIARQGQEAPGTRGVFRRFLWSPGLLNGSGQVAFIAEVALPAVMYGFWISGPGGLQLVATNGLASTDANSPAPLALDDSSEAYILNDGRLIVFDSTGHLWAGAPDAFKKLPVSIDLKRWHTVRCSGMMAFSRRGTLWAGELGNLHKIVSPGDELEYASDESRKISGFSCSVVGVTGFTLVGTGGPSGLGTSGFGGPFAGDVTLQGGELQRFDRYSSQPINDRGQIAFKAFFDKVRGKHDECQGLYLATVPLRPTDGSGSIE